MELLDELKKITPDGFVFKSNIKGYARYETETNYGINIIGLGSILNGVFRGIKAQISFFSIEEVLRPAFAIDKETNYNVTLTTDQHGFIHNKPIGQGVYENLPLELNSEEALAKMQMLIKRFIEQDAFPFFEYWTDIRAFLPFIESVPFTELHQYFYNDGLLKKMVIWKLCSHPMYAVFVVEQYERIEKYITNNGSSPFAQKDFKRFKILIKQLEKTTPLYEWDPAYLIPKEL